MRFLRLPVDHDTPSKNTSTVSVKKDRPKGRRLNYTRPSKRSTQPRQLIKESEE